MFLRWYSWLPWEKLKRATFMPCRMSWRSTSSSSVAGPMVQTILVFFLENAI